MRGSDWDCFLMFGGLGRGLSFVSEILVHSIDGSKRLGVFLDFGGREGVYHYWVSLFSTVYAGESDWERFLDILVAGKELIFRQVSYPLSCWEKVIWNGFGHLKGWEQLSSECESFVHSDFH